MSIAGGVGRDDDDGGTRSRGTRGERSDEEIAAEIAGTAN
jgi:hypothetical protein